MENNPTPSLDEVAEKEALNNYLIKKFGVGYSVAVEHPASAHFIAGYRTQNPSEETVMAVLEIFNEYIKDSAGYKNKRQLSEILSAIMQKLKEGR